MVSVLSLKLMPLSFYKGCHRSIDKAELSVTKLIYTSWNVLIHFIHWLNLHLEGVCWRPLGFQMWQTHICPKVTAFVSGKYFICQWQLLLPYPFDIPERLVTILAFLTAPCWEKNSCRSLSLTWRQSFRHSSLKWKEGKHCTANLHLKWWSIDAVVLLWDLVHSSPVAE